MSASTTIPASHTAPDDLPLGAHLVTPRRLYMHHGMYAGNGRVIHYSGFKRLFRLNVIEEISLEEFTKGRCLQVRTHAAPQFPGAASVKRARSRLGEQRYSLIRNNCEHLVEWSLSGRSRSSQVEGWKRRLLGWLVRGRTVQSLGDALLVSIFGQLPSDECRCAADARPALAPTPALPRASRRGGSESVSSEILPA